MQNNGYWPYVSNLVLSQRQNETGNKHTFIHEHKSEQKLLRCEMNATEKGSESVGSGTDRGPGQKRDYT